MTQIKREVFQLQGDVAFHFYILAEQLYPIEPGVHCVTKSVAAAPFFLVANTG